MLDMSMSLDGFVAGENDHSEQPLGDNGSILHNWLFSGEMVSKYNDFFKLSSSSRVVFDESIEKTGAILVGRRTYDIVGGWGGSHPSGVPVHVLTHNVPNEVPVGSTPFHFETNGIHRAVERAKETSGEKHVGVAGATVTQQCIKHGLLDEIHLHVAPVLLGKGVRLFDHIGDESVRLEKLDVVDSQGVTHIKYRVLK